MIDAYKFIVPEWTYNNYDYLPYAQYAYPEYYYDVSEHYKLSGNPLAVSELCNPHFVNNLNNNCEDIAKYKWCDVSVRVLVYYGVLNENGTFETNRQCPQCGCGVNGADNLNDLYADEVAGLRKFLNDEQRKNNM